MVEVSPSPSQLEMPRRQRSSALLSMFAIVVFLFGAYLRYRFICVENRPSDPENIIGDAAWYAYEAGNMFREDFVPTLYDTLFPPGTALYFHLLMKLDPTLLLIDRVQWILASLVPLLLSGIALRIYGTASALATLILSSVYFPLWEYFGYLISEGPFLFSLLLSFLFLVLSLQGESGKSKVFWGFFMGFFLGLSAICKSCSLFTALLVFLTLVFFKRREISHLVPTVFPALFGVLLVIIPTSIRATWMNEGRFLLIANDAPRTFLLGHQGRTGLTWWYDRKRNFQMNFSNPSATQHMYAGEKSYEFGPYDARENFQAGWEWIRGNWGEALSLSLEHVFDMFAIVLPWPGYFRSYAPWVKFFHYYFLALILLPAAFSLGRTFPRVLKGEKRYLGDALLLSSVISIFILAFLFLGEGRYRICYDGFLLILASQAYLPLSARRRVHRL